jgi:hypothetical protein
MRFWELISIMRTDTEALQSLLRDERWVEHRQWYSDIRRLVCEQDRKILDSVVPEELARSAMAVSSHRFQLRNGYLYPYQVGDAPVAYVSALDIYLLFGGAAIEEALEKGSVKVD